MPDERLSERLRALDFPTFADEVANLEQALAEAQRIANEIADDRMRIMAQRDALVKALREARVRIRGVFGGMGPTSAVWGNSLWDKGHSAGVLSALTAFDDATREALAPLSQPAKCPACYGSGKEPLEAPHDEGTFRCTGRPCVKCDGTGKISQLAPAEAPKAEDTELLDWLDTHGLHLRECDQEHLEHENGCVQLGYDGSPTQLVAKGTIEMRWERLSWRGAIRAARAQEEK